jgi:hypothetical protein
MRHVLPVLAAVIAVTTAPSAHAQSAEAANDAPMPIKSVSITYGGFVKLDALYSNFSDGDVSPLDQGRDYFRPSSVPVAASAASEDSHGFLDMHAKDSRFFFKADADVKDHKLGALLELDFRSLPGAASEVVTNGYNPRLRRAVITFDEWSGGQDWTTFRNNDAAPEVIDDIGGVVEALHIVRQPLIRYQRGGLQVALENAETNILPRAGTAAGATPVTAMFVTGDSSVPDLVVRYDLKFDFGAFSAAGLLRHLRADNVATGGDAPNNFANGTAVAWGVDLAGKVPTFAGAEVRFSGTYGDGMGRYVALGTVADAVVDSNSELETIPIAAGYVSYRQPWSAKWRSNLTVGAMQADNEASLTPANATKSVASGHLNLLYFPVDKLMYGVEYMHAIREIQNGEDGTLDRLQFSAKFSF